jgi:hypothetical protein
MLVVLYCQTPTYVECWKGAHLLYCTSYQRIPNCMQVSSITHSQLHNLLNQGPLSNLETYTKWTRPPTTIVGGSGKCWTTSSLPANCCSFVYKFSSMGPHRPNLLHPHMWICWTCLCKRPTVSRLVRNGRAMLPTSQHMLYCVLDFPHPNKRTNTCHLSIFLNLGYLHFIDWSRGCHIELVDGGHLVPPYELWGVSHPCGGSPPEKFLPPSDFFLNPTENCCLPHPTSKKHCPCILEGCLPTNPILSADHLQGLKSNIYI